MKRCINSIFVILIFASCMPVKREVAVSKTHDSNAAWGKKIVMANRNFAPPPLAPRAAKKVQMLDRKPEVAKDYVYKDKSFKELLKVFPFMRTKKIDQFQYFEHDVKKIKDILSLQPLTEDHFLALNVLKESYVFYTKKNRLYSKITGSIKKLGQNEISSRQARFAGLVSQMYDVIRNTFVNESQDYRLRANALRYMKAMKGKNIVDYFVRDALEEIISSENAPLALVGEARKVLKESGDAGEF